MCKLFKCYFQLSGYVQCIQEATKDDMCANPFGMRLNVKKKSVKNFIQLFFGNIVYDNVRNTERVIQSFDFFFQALCVTHNFHFFSILLLSIFSITF